MRLTKHIAKAILPLAILIPSLASAVTTITFPALDIQNFGADSGFSVTASSLNIDATVFGIKLDDSGGFIVIPDESFTLTSTSGSFSSIDGGGFFSGNFTVSGGLLAGTFTDLLVFDYGAGLMQVEGKLVYTSGSLATGLTGGNLLLSIDGSGVAGKLGPVVVPVPAAIWLFGTGLIGLVGIARRKV